MPVEMSMETAVPIDFQEAWAEAQRCMNERVVAAVEADDPVVLDRASKWMYLQPPGGRAEAGGGSNKPWRGASTLSPSEMLNEYLRCLVGEYAPASRPAAVRAMSEVASMYLQGRLPGWFNRLFASARLVAHVKTPCEGGATDMRHVAVGEAERRAAERAVASVGLEVRFDKMHAYSADMEAACGVRLRPTSSGPSEMAITESRCSTCRSDRKMALLKHCMQHKAGYRLRNCLPSEVEAFAEAVDANVLAAVERVLGVSFDPSTYGTGTNPVVTDFLAELLHDSDPMAAKAATFSEDAVARARSRLHLATRLGPYLAEAASSARRYDHFLNDARGSGSYAAAVREAERTLFNHLDAASGMWTVAIFTARTVMTPRELREIAAGYFFLPSPCLAPVIGSQIILPST
eukprot:jgi/Tetstr1/461579/TSEL_006680.t1